MTTEIPKRRTVKVRLDPPTLSLLLALPEGCRVIAADSTNDPVGINLIVQGDDLPEVPHDAESPFASMMLESVRLDDGRVFLRVERIEVPR